MDVLAGETVELLLGRGELRLHGLETWLELSPVLLEADPAEVGGGRILFELRETLLALGDGGINSDLLRGWRSELILAGDRHQSGLGICLGFEWDRLGVAPVVAVGLGDFCGLRE